MTVIYTFIILAIVIIVVDCVVELKIINEKEDEIYRKGHSDGYDKGYDDCIDNIKTFGYKKIVGNEEITMEEFLDKINANEEDLDLENDE